MEKPEYSSEQDLFQREKKILVEIQADLEKNEYAGNPLLPKYEALVKAFATLLESSRRVFRISDRLQNNAKKIEVNLKLLLDNAGQGFFAIKPDLTIYNEYSAECRNIFGTNIEGKDFIQLINSVSHPSNPQFAALMNGLFSAAGETERQKYLHQLPRIITIDDKNISMQYRYINIEGEENRLLIIMTNITDRQKAEEEIAYLSYHDKLTGLFNRFYVDSLLPVLDQAHQLPLSLIMADMNGLKMANDVFGHMAGDVMLMRLASVLRHACRQDIMRQADIPVRWGGDEFLIIMPRTTSEQCHNVVDRIRMAMLEESHDPILLSASLGTATRTDDRISVSELFSMAEDDMYLNKYRETQYNRGLIMESLKKRLWSLPSEGEDHHQRLRNLCSGFGPLLNFSAEECAILEKLVELHDIGMITVPAEVLEKPAAFDEHERLMLEKHCEVGFRLANSIGETVLANAILCHHEHYDGGGYPRSIEASSIPGVSRAFSIMDAFEAMTQPRVYGRIFSVEEALLEIEHLAGRQFDPAYSEIFTRFVRTTFADYGLDCR